MVKIFILNDHRELERVINTWIKKHDVQIIDIKYTSCSLDCDVIYSVLIYYSSYKDKPC